MPAGYGGSFVHTTIGYSRPRRSQAGKPFRPFFAGNRRAPPKNRVPAATAGNRHIADRDYRSICLRGPARMADNLFRGGSCPRTARWRSRQHPSSEGERHHGQRGQLLCYYTYDMIIADLRVVQTGPFGFLPQPSGPFLCAHLNTSNPIGIPYFTPGSLRSPPEPVGSPPLARCRPAAPRQRGLAPRRFP